MLIEDDDCVLCAFLADQTVCNALLKLDVKHKMPEINEAITQEIFSDSWMRNQRFQGELNTNADVSQKKIAFGSQI